MEYQIGDQVYIIEHHKTSFRKITGPIVAVGSNFIVIERTSLKGVKYRESFWTDKDKKNPKIQKAS